MRLTLWTDGRKVDLPTEGLFVLRTFKPYTELLYSKAEQYRVLELAETVLLLIEAEKKNG